METSDLTSAMARRASLTGAAVGAVATPYTFQRTFMTRSDLDQAIVTGLGFTLTHALASTIQETLQSGVALASRSVSGDTSPAAWSRSTIAADLVAAAGGMLVQRIFRQRENERLSRAAIRTAGHAIAVTGATGAAVGGIQESTDHPNGWRAAATVAGATGLVAAQREWDRRRREALLDDQGLEPSTISPARSLAMGAGVSLAATLVAAAEGAIATRTARLASRLLPGDQLVWRPIGHAVSLAVLSSLVQAGGRRVFRQIERQQFAVEPAMDVPPPYPEVSGSPESEVDFGSLAKMGRRFVWTVRTPEIIEEVTGAPATAMPIRVFVGLKSAETEEARVAKAMAELRRTGAFDRRWLMITTPTGTGYGNYAAAGALEFLSRGDCANVVHQYGARPSPISLDRVAEGRLQVRLLVDAIAAELADRPADRRPTVVMFGESLGAWSSQDAFIGRGTKGLDDAGIDRAIWIGTPTKSQWKDEVTGPDRPDVDRSLVGIFNDIGEWEALDDEARARIRYVMITHHNDGVSQLGPRLAIQAPEWLRPGRDRPARVFEADGHDYRGDIVPFLSAVLGFDASDAEQAAIVDGLETEERRRTRWIEERGEVGESMAAVVLEEIRRSDPETFESAVRAVRQDLISRDRSRMEP